ncbi:hypothetical protein DXG01_006010 [Tephrocybe rancida]|nr:hypothetical protein DXG01_006010 [Tephrocybe rancida]
MPGGCKNIWALGLKVNVLLGRFKVPKARIRTSANSTTSYSVSAGSCDVMAIDKPEFESQGATGYFEVYRTMRAKPRTDLTDALQFIEYDERAEATRGDFEFIGRTVTIQDNISGEVRGRIFEERSSTNLVHASSVVHEVSVRWETRWSILAKRLSKGCELTYVYKLLTSSKSSSMSRLSSIYTNLEESAD